MEKLIIYIHGKNGGVDEAYHYEMLFKDYDVIGFDYYSKYPWEAKKEFLAFYESVCCKYKSTIIIANSIGAYFVLNSLSNCKIEKAFFISPIVNMEKLIVDMMEWSNVTENELREKREIKTNFGETLSWEYLCYIRNNPIKWEIPTHILYGKNDNLIPLETICEFAKTKNRTLTIMEEGEHWFHTPEQMKFLDDWIENVIE